MKYAIIRSLLIFLTTLCSVAAFAEEHPASGLVLEIRRAERIMVVSCDEIPNYMAPMTMSFKVSDTSTLKQLEPGSKIDFVMRDGHGTLFATDVRIREFGPNDIRPLSAHRLRKLQEQAAGAKPPQALKVGELVPDFSLTDQLHRNARLSQFAGKVVAISFMYTRCALPEYCYRLSNNLSQVRRRFANSLGRDLILLTITFDPIHDQPEQLARYAKTWGADPATWHFLTGTESEVRRVCNLFGVDAYLDEGTMIHSLHTVIIGRDGRLLANVNGNDYSAQQLGDLVAAGIKPRVQ